MYYGRFPYLNFLKFFIRRYYCCLIICAGLLLLQLFWGYYILYVDIETKESSISDGTGKQPLLQFSQPVSPHIQNEGSNQLFKGYAESLRQNYSQIDDIDEECIIKGKGAISALKRARTEECKAKIQSLACKTENRNLYPKRLVNSCPSNGNVKGQRLGCYTDNIGNRILKGYKTQLVNNHPNLCADICLQRGYIYAGVEYSNECFCGSDGLPMEFRIPGERCDMKCSGDLTNSNCGGFLTIDILYTGLAEYSPSIALKESEAVGPEVKIAFILTVNGRSLRQIHRLIKALYSKRHFFYIHVDARQHYLYTELLKLEGIFPNIILSRNRLASIWGGASLLTVLLNSMEQLIRMQEWQWDFVINLSESDYPIQKVSNLTKFLTANRDKNFLKSHGQNTNSFLKKQGLDRTFLECEQHMWRIGERRLPLGIRVDGGSDWLCLGRKFVEYVVFSKDKLVVELKKIFYFTLLPAESFFHTVLRNCEMCHTFTDNNLHLTNWNRKLGCRCQYKDVVDWCGCSPNDFVITDWAKIRASGKRNLYFGRKFEPVKSLSIINKLDEYLYGKLQGGTAGFDTHWENRYHKVDHPSGRSDIELTLYHSVARQSIALFKTCDVSFSHITEVHTIHRNDSYQGIIVQYVAQVDSRNLSLEVFITKESQFEKHMKHPMAKYLKLFQINTNFDVKEQMFRNFEEALGPDTKLTAAFWWHDNFFGNELTGNSFNITLVLIDPFGVLAANEAIVISKGQQQMTHDLLFKEARRPGLWTAFLIFEDDILAQNVLTILSSEFHNGIRRTDEDRELNKLYGSYGNLKEMEYEKFIFSEESAKKVRQLNEKLSQEKSPGLFSDSIVKSIYTQKDTCLVDYKMLPPCLEHVMNCDNSSWSSVSPDPKSTVVWQ